MFNSTFGWNTLGALLQLKKIRSEYNDESPVSTMTAVTQEHEDQSNFLAGILFLISCTYVYKRTY